VLEPAAEGAKKTISGGRLPAAGGSDGAVRVGEVVGGYVTRILGRGIGYDDADTHFLKKH